MVSKERPPEVRALIFDLGKVVFDFSFDDTLAAWAQETGLSVQELNERFVWDGTIERYERGEIDLSDFYRQVSRQIGHEMPLSRFELAWTNIFRDEIPGMNSVLKDLKRRYRLVALSNTNVDHARVWRRRYPESLSNFEMIFASHEIGARKPESRAFERVLDYLGLGPGETVFVDDYIENISAAARLGFHTILFQDCAQLKAELRRMNLLFPRSDLDSKDRIDLLKGE